MADDANSEGRLRTDAEMEVVRKVSAVTTPFNEFMSNWQKMGTSSGSTSSPQGDIIALHFGYVPGGVGRAKQVEIRPVIRNGVAVLDIEFT